MKEKIQVWNLYLKAEKFSRRPSSFIPDLFDDWAIWQVDNSVLYFGMAIEALLAETMKSTVGTETEIKPRYTISQLLDPKFRLPAPESQQAENPFAALLDWADRPGSGVKKYQYVGPPKPPAGEESAAS